MKTLGTKITIDPGTAGTGFALWDKNWKLMDYGNLYGKSKDWKSKTIDISRSLSQIVKDFNVEQAYIEKPRKFNGVFGSMVADKGDLVKLSMFVGYLDGYLNIPMEFVEIIDWKGTLPKDIVEKRVRKIFPEIKAKSHCIDAVGIGLYLRGEKSFK